jgi:hypothetical protein
MSAPTSDAHPGVVKSVESVLIEVLQQLSWSQLHVVVPLAGNRWKTPEIRVFPENSHPCPTIPSSG